MTTVVNCPTCHRDVVWTPENRFRPFCSERCKQIDLGAWASGKYTIGGAPLDPSGDHEHAQDQNHDQDDTLS